MSVTSGFFNSLSGDRKYDAIQISSMFDGLITDGIYNGFLESFMVTASDPASMVVTVGEGRCWFNHTWTLNDAPLPLTLDVGDVVLNRIDTVVIDVDSTDTVRACTIKVVKGTPSSQAVAPTLENTETHHQYPLCDISVVAGATTVTQSNITNRRGTSDCPFVATLMTTVTVDELLLQWESQWNDWMTDRANSMDSWTAEQQEAFTTWFQTVQDILDEDTAGNLLNRINHRTGINATATYSAGVVAITAPDDAGEILTFVAPSDFLSTDTYTLNGEALTITDLNGETLDDSWKKNSPITITVSGGKAFFKAGGSGKNDTLPPLLGNMTVEVVEGDENDTYTIKMDKLVLDKTTEMVGGAQLEWGEEMPVKPGKGTGGIKTWTREEVITTGKPYDGLYLGDVKASDGVTETLIYLPENQNGKVVLAPFVVLSVDYLGGVAVTKKYAWQSSQFDSTRNKYIYDGSVLDSLISTTYLNSVLDSSIVEQLLEVDLPSNGGTIKRKAFQLSATELGLASTGWTQEGTAFPYFSSSERRILRTEAGTAATQWTRSRWPGESYPAFVNNSGAISGNQSTSSYMARPSFVLPKDFKIQQRPDGSYTVWNEAGLMTLGDIEPGNEVNILETSGLKPAIFVQNQYNGKSTGVTVRKNTEGSYFAYGSSSTYEGSSAYQMIQSYISSVIDSSVRNKLIEMEVKSFNDETDTVSTVKTMGADLGVEELGYSTSGWGTGTHIEYFKTDAERKALGENGSANAYWLRDRPGSGVVWACGTTGGLATPGQATLYFHRPMLFFDITAPIRLLADGAYDLVPEDPALSTQTVSTLAETGTPVQLKDIPVSTAGNKVTVKIPETGGEQEYITLRENYDGVSGGYALMRNNTAPGARFHATPDGGDKPYQNSELDTHVQNFADYLNESVRKYLVEGSVLIGVSGSQVTLKRSIFLPSVKEVGYTFVSIYPEGTPFEYFNSDNSRKSDNDYWTRSKDMSSGSGNADYISLSQGGLESASQTSIKPIRPIILISGEAWFTDNGDGTYTFVGDEPTSSEFVSHTVEVPHGQKVVFRQFTQNQKKQFQTMLVGGVYPPLGEVEPPFALPEFTGNCAIFGDETAGRIELYESGELTLSPGTYDFFLVGGGASGGAGSDTNTGGGGGGSGYSTTQIGVEITGSEGPISIIVGAGSLQSSGNAYTGSQTAITISHDFSITANPGKSGGRYTYGSDGGCGGGSSGGAGGSDGGNGSKNSQASGSVYVPGTGQGTTMRAFEEPAGTLYGGGGGGGGSGYMSDYSGGAGGSPGGGAGAMNSGGSYPYSGTAGTPNTGGGGGGGKGGTSGLGGAGGSGIVIIRWNNAAQ